MHYLLRLGMMALIVMLSANCCFAQVQTARYNTTLCANSKGFYEYLPMGYSSGNENYPLIIFIHGMGDLGNGNHAELPRVLNNGIPKLIGDGDFPQSFNVNNQNHKFIVISPQFIDWPVPGDIEQVINYAISHYRINTGRIYLTGFSMGGGAVWDYAGNNSNYAGRIAAIVPVCGGSWPEPSRAYVIGDANLPVWATHNNGDPTVPVHYTHDYVSGINSRSPTPLAKKTIFNSNTHDAWTQTYDPLFTENGLNVYEWMLQYQRNFAVLPVRLAEYTVYRSASDKVTMKWSTIEEFNNHHFNIERSADGISFTSIGTVPGNHTAGNYSFTDEHPLQGYNYYRLTQTDINGSVRYFSIHLVKFEADDLNGLLISPNPVAGPLQIKLEAEEKGSLTFRLISSSGTVIRQWSLYKNQYEITQEIETSTLKPGLYFIEARGRTYGKINSFVKK